jgi:hypothetical protein
MKKLLLLIPLLLSSTYFQAQTEESVLFGYSQGDFLATAAMAYSTEENKETEFEATTKEFTPEVSYFLSDHISIGLRGRYATFEEKRADETTVDDEATGFGIFGRYYIWSRFRLSAFGELGVNYANIKDNSNQVDASIIDVTISPGINFFISDKFVLTSTLGLLQYETVSEDSDLDSTTTRFNFSLNGARISLGLSYRF